MPTKKELAAYCTNGENCLNCKYPDCLWDGVILQDFQTAKTLDHEAHLESKDRRYVQCAAYQRAYYEANKEKIAAQKRAYYEANKEKIAAYQRAYYEANGERCTDCKEKGPSDAGTPKGARNIITSAV